MTTKTQKDAEAEGANQGTPEVDLHPDKVIGDSVFRWTGKMVHTAPMTRAVSEIVTDKAGRSFVVQRSVDAGAEETRFAGECAICGRETYALVQGNPALIGEALAVFAASGKNEAPIVYCTKHDPGEQHRKNGAQAQQDMDGVVVRLR